MMDVSNNSISGTLPPEYSALSMNQLSGSLPASYAAWPQINSFQVSQNRINGTLPSEYANWSVAMNNFDVSDCNLTGSIPPEYGNWTSTNFFTVQRNALNGTLPFTLGMWTRLGMFDVSHNDLNGALPSSFAGWMAPKSVRVSWNALRGTLSPDFSAWGAELIEFDATHNLISGIIPVEWGRTWTGPTAVSLGNNCLKGWVPDDLAMNAAVVEICNTRVATSLSPNQVVCPAGLLNAWPPACVPEESFSITASAPQLCLPIISFDADDRAAGSVLVNDTFISVPPTDFNTLSSPAAVVVAIVRVTQDNGAHFYPRRTRTNSTTTTPAPSAPTSIIGSSSEEYRLTVDILTLPISRSVFKSAPVLLVNVSVWHALPLRTWDVSSVVSSWSDDSSGDKPASAPLNWTVLAASAAATPSSSSLSSTYNSSSSWQVLRLLSPTLDERQGGGGWLPITTPPLVSRVVKLRIAFSCGDEEVLDVNLLIPAPGYPQQLASQVEAATRYSQVASALAGGASSGSALGRVMAIRSMVVCDANAAVGGGVLDFDLHLCPSSAETDIARSAVVSNVVVLACVFVFLLLLLSCVWAHARGVSLRSALLVFSMPSSAYPACVAVLPSTAAAVALLIARVNSSTCVGLDTVLIVLGLVVVVGCPSALLALWTIRGMRTSQQKWTCQKRGGAVLRIPSRERSNNSATTSSILTAATSRAALCLHGALGPVLCRSWKWHRQGNPTESSTTTTGDSNMMKSVWVVLLEYRVLWFAALDAGMLVVIAMLAVVSGLGGASSSDVCQSTTAVVLVLLVAQLLLMVTLRPYRTLFAVVHGAVTLVLTCLSVGAQLAFIVSSFPADEEDSRTNSVEGLLWLVNASAGCNLAVVGVTAVKMLFDVKDLLDAISRRLRQDRIHHSASSLLSPPCGTGEGLPGVLLPSPTTPLESSILSLATIEEDECRGASPTASLPTMMIAMDDETFEDHFGNKKFWDVNGNARREQHQQHQHVDSRDVD
ncbi:GP46-like surface antigen, putative [Bodo saltans]|uniref:GP46-like surface antigen, putative n=1 Tax=Bodo saltans TaxID=75058 RepID=A0A0S4IND6_BODSA|nr:GP46-like surface antigen, putative [Bodo saltans]|eukprot:CUE76009.1 GP46-like surface antigen, putative [Bodo saltans]